MPEKNNKKIDGADKASEEEIKKSRKIILNFIGEKDGPDNGGGEKGGTKAEGPFSRLRVGKKTAAPQVEKGNDGKKINLEEAQEEIRKQIGLPNETASAAAVSVKAKSAESAVRTLVPRPVVRENIRREPAVVKKSKNEKAASNPPKEVKKIVKKAENKPKKPIEVFKEKSRGEKKAAPRAVSSGSRLANPRFIKHTVALLAVVLILFFLAALFCAAIWSGKGFFLGKAEKTIQKTDANIFKNKKSADKRDMGAKVVDDILPGVATE